MQLKECMTRNVELVRPDDNLKLVAEKMRDEDTGALPVCDGKRISGFITDRDIVIRGLAYGSELERLRVTDVMTKKVFYCFEDEDVRDAIQLMQKKQVRRLIVLDRDKKLAGIVSLGDLAIRSERHELVGKALREISGVQSLESPEGSVLPSLLAVGSLGGLAVLGYFLLKKPEVLPERLQSLSKTIQETIRKKTA